MKTIWTMAALICAATAPALGAPPDQLADRGPAASAPVQEQAARAPDWMDGITGKKLVAVDGSTLSFTYTEDGLNRAIVSPSGDTQQSAFAFINEKLGTVSNADASANVVGFFRRVDSGFEVTYADGRIENISAAPDGGVRMTLHAPDNSAYCMGWYPQGHVFNEAERRAALAEYAQKLGLAAAAGGTPDASCGPDQQASTETSDNAPAQRRHPLKGTSVAMAPPAPVTVQASVVHAIDAADQVSANATPGGGASSCLRVDSDGAHWGFRNHCGFGVRFSYCLDSADANASCNKGTQSGSVAANGFEPLFSQSALKDLDAQQNFRWVACGEDGGKIEAKLDQPSPPSGRCIRASAS
ncbi:MAG TPA: hypothetical protein VHW02_01685 [Rhizomicrobium sp.]|jgi:hypothetical protein|nr:hypothetical protein [Rhizomicrobium sp.]